MCVYVHTCRLTARGARIARSVALVYRNGYAYLNVPDDHNLVVAVEDVLPFGVPVDDQGNTTLGGGQGRKDAPWRCAFVREGEKCPNVNSAQNFTFTCMLVARLYRSMICKHTQQPTDRQDINN